MSATQRSSVHEILNRCREEKYELQKQMSELVHAQLRTHEKALQEVALQGSLRQKVMWEEMEAALLCACECTFEMGTASVETKTLPDGVVSATQGIEYCPDVAQVHLGTASETPMPKCNSAVSKVSKSREHRSHFSGTQMLKSARSGASETSSVATLVTHPVANMWSYTRSWTDDGFQRKLKAKQDYRSMMLNIEDKSLKLNVSSFDETFDGWTSQRDRCIHKCEGPRCRSMVNSSAFFYFTAFAILANTIYVAIVTNLEIQSAFEEYDSQESVTERPFWVLALNSVFLAALTFELALRMASNCLGFWVGVDCKLNLCDLVVVVCALLEVLTIDNPGVSHLRVLRVLRLLQTIRLLRVMRSFHQFRLMILAMLRSLIPLVWVIAFLMLIIFIFAVIFVTGVTSYLDEAPAVDDPTVRLFRTFFSSVPLAVLTLFMAITGGVNWWEIERAFLEVSLFHAVLLIMYICVMFVAVLNTVTAIFVTDAIDLAAMDKDIWAHTNKERRRALVAELHDLFLKLDDDRSGNITLAEFERFTKRDDVAAMFQALDINIHDSHALFRALDVDDDEELDIDEFVLGCFHVQGGATAVSMHLLMEETRRAMRKSDKLAESLEDHISSTEERLQFTLMKLENYLAGMVQI